MKIPSRIGIPLQAVGRHGADTVQGGQVAASNASDKEQPR